MDLDNLRLRLANLGVDVNASARANQQQASPTKKTRASGAAGPDPMDEHQDVLDVLERCHRVEASFADHPSTSTPNREESNLEGAHRQEAKRRGRKGVKFDVGSRAPTVGGLRTGQRLNSRCKNIHTPLGSVLAQYREAEEHWAREKAMVRRDAFYHRKRAHRLDLENKKLAAMNHHKTLDIRALKNALASRDSQLQAMQKKTVELESLLSDNHEAMAQDMIELSSERDQLRSLLNATLKRLEAVDEFVYRTAISSSAMEEKLKKLETERSRALDEASRSHGLKKELHGTKTQLNLQKELVRKMSEIQLRKNRKQQNTIRAVLENSGPSKNPMALAAAMSEGVDNEDEEVEELRGLVAGNMGDLPPAIQSILGR
ncbi:hypothetical protein BSKO_03784 [Bryopsis sp. KO-2023]|nr:hypothetical protein BSKO_03784 [Bryopsis sp. KO-2023]